MPQQYRLENGRFGEILGEAVRVVEHGLPHRKGYKVEEMVDNSKFLDTFCASLFRLVSGQRPTFRGVGIEIEVECENNLPESAPTGWVKTGDGSLRGYDTAEYVIKGPKLRDDAFKTLDLLGKKLKSHGSIISDSVRAGIHIHIDVGELTIREMVCFAMCYYILEEQLTSYCGKGRSGNHFCLRAMDAESIVYELARGLSTGKLFTAIGHDHTRYSALNFNSLFKYGSLEFRAMRTTTDFDRVKTWVDILLTIKETSKMFKTPLDIVEQFSAGGERTFLRNVLREHSALFENKEGMSESLMDGMRLVQSIAYCRKDW